MQPIYLTIIYLSIFYGLLLLFLYSFLIYSYIKTNLFYTYQFCFSIFHIVSLNSSHKGSTLISDYLLYAVLSFSISFVYFILGNPISDNIPSSGKIT